MSDKSLRCYFRCLWCGSTGVYPQVMRRDGETDAAVRARHQREVRERCVSDCSFVVTPR